MGKRKICGTDNGTKYIYYLIQTQNKDEDKDDDDEIYFYPRSYYVCWSILESRWTT